MLGKIFNPFSLSVLAFFPLVAWQGGLAGLTVPSGLGQGKLPRRASADSDAPASGWGQASPVGTSPVGASPIGASPIGASPIGASPSGTGPYPGQGVGPGPTATYANPGNPAVANPAMTGPDQLMAAAQPTLQRLQAMGAQYLRVEQVQQGPSTYYRCRCELGAGPGQSGGRPLEAHGIDPQSAALGVLNQILAQAPVDHLSYQSQSYQGVSR